ncbi:MAG TPA: glycosyltransferase family 4 protein [Bryobacteraceae bacterium]|nr:hypothetical protein [Bryobacterales bacterium]HRJ20196.1 glycosyltransferase family 4 protein [Bryobacteraceae bacterium]
MTKTIGVLCYNLCDPTAELLERVGSQVAAELVVYPLQAHGANYSGPLRVGGEATQRQHIHVPSLGTKERLMLAPCAGTVKRAVGDCDLVMVLGLLGAPLVSLQLWRMVHGKPVVVVTQMMPKELESGRPRWLRLVKRVLLGRRLDYVAQTRATVETLRHLYSIPVDRITYAPFTPALQTSGEMVNLRGSGCVRIAPKGELRLLFVGTLHHLKGLDVLLEALGQLQAERFQLTIAGVPPVDEPQYWEELRRSERYRAIEGRIHYAGHLNPHELAAVYREHDVLVHPTRKDVWPKVIEEAMSFGLPVITTTHCGSGAELVKEGKTGFIVRAGDALALRGAIEKLVEDRKRLAGMRGYLEHHWDRSARRAEETRQISGLLNRILATAGGRWRTN